MRTLRFVVVLFATTAIPSLAQTFTTLHSFDHNDGAAPQGAPVQGRSGNLYGTTSFGGPDAADGTVFEMEPSGALATLHGFCPQTDCPDGNDSFATLIQGTDGNFYGTNAAGGAHGGGTVFGITPNGTLSTIYAFCSQSNCADGAFPAAGLIQGTDGNFYGTTYSGGVTAISAGIAGTVFRISPTGTLTTLYDFCSQSNCPDGMFPVGLVQGADGNFYGTTESGGAHAAGTVFKVTPSGTMTTLHSFCSETFCTDGQSPYAGLTQAGDGNFYGTTFNGGANYSCPNGCGGIFKITSGGNLTPLYSFCPQSGCTDGSNPRATLIQATDGNLYGTTWRGGTSANAGTIFKVTPSGTLSTLYSFCPQSGCVDGEGPVAGLMQDTDGNFYGMTPEGGVNNDGTVFKLAVGLSPFVETQTASGRVGKVVEILGTDLMGATGVSFNGVAASFTVVSNSFITASVPTGATTGYVTVTTPSATLTSNKKFRVEP